MMDRRAFITITAGNLFAQPLVSRAQQTAKTEAALAFFDTAEGTSSTGSERIVPSPALVIPAREIMSVIVEPSRSGYRATIRIDFNAAHRLYQFTERNIGKRVDIRFDGERLSVLSIVAPVSSGLVALDAGQSDARINKIFAPLGSKLIWKRDGR